ncbi:hypothetical protein [Pimelobacter simplex]|nr:hypothetical protein [Pimelobacter simplex]
MSSAPLVDSPAVAHDHEWHLASVENEPGGVVTEYVCGGCPAVIFR